MSVKAIQWALMDAPVDDPTEALLLVALADRCSGEDGQGAWPSHAWLAKRCRVSERTVRRLLVKLAKDGLIGRGDQRMVAHLPADRRPIVWDLILTAGHPRPVVHDRPDTHDRSSMTERGVMGDRTGGHGCPTNQVLNQVLTTPSSVVHNASGFDDFWNAYPRRTGKEAARQAWARAVKRAGDPDVILEGLKRYRFNDDPQYRPYPATWLNQSRWEDEDGPEESGTVPYESIGHPVTNMDEAREVWRRIQAAKTPQQRDEDDRMANRGKYKPWNPPKGAVWDAELDSWTLDGQPVEMPS